MAERALLSPDELKNLPKGRLHRHEDRHAPDAHEAAIIFQVGHFVRRTVSGAGRAQREVYYAGKEELLMNIKKSLYSKPQPITTTKADGYMSSYGDK